jgi:hypothetical protein
MMAQADHLIAATERTRHYTGWETIAWGFKLLPPRAWFPHKPAFGAGNYLGHIAGDASWHDETTQVAYGIFANLYNAFGLGGVLIGSIVTFACFYYWLGIFFANPRWTAAPVASTMWLIFIVGLHQHLVVESSVSTLLASFTNEGAVWLMCFLAPGAAALLSVFADPPRCRWARMTRIERTDGMSAGGATRR